ncbi:O-antigen ligase family protein [Halomonas campisalis]|uniref:O-antigen ligase family protein n=1 Tax=Billgrantia campisalis TaxID=74661 RepID=A0ABS9P3Y9_9GAMM|nr:O-antigen ligase family protein [Halomonas campisalis]MCG6656321.1 O-antigen ligase family protein [Halomonas campisalis]MDR5861507.1 O-antigen ligase family protein [Halomonas campisalis]
MRHGEIWQGLNGVLLFAFVALLIVVHMAYAVVPLLALAVMVLGSGVLWLTGEDHGTSRARRSLLRAGDDAWLVLVLLAYGGLWLLDVWRTGHWPVGEGNQRVLLPLWPLLATALLVWLLRYPPSPRLLWWAVCSGALGAGSIALYERLVLGRSRASNAMNAIPFGNLSLLLGTLSLLAALWCLRRGYPRSRVLLGTALLAAVSGMLGSLLSGTRGGWIAVPFLLLLAYRAARDLVPSRWRYGLAGLVVLVLLVAAAVPHTGVSHRIVQAVTNVQQYWQGETRANSVGARLEMWRGGILLVRERPWLGWGEGRMEMAIHDLVLEGRLPAAVERHDQLHSDVIDTMARRGVVGLTGLLMLYGVPLWLCWRRLRRPGADPGTQVLAAAGMMVPVAFIDFGLTQSMLRDVRGLSGYLGLCVACWVALRAHERRLSLPHERAAPESSS